ncbi:hypothetical protein K7432_017923, partial [Basidiobolus ranarum]
MHRARFTTIIFALMIEIQKFSGAIKKVGAISRDKAYYSQVELPKLHTRGIEPRSTAWQALCLEEYLYNFNLGAHLLIVPPIKVAFVWKVWMRKYWSGLVWLGVD